MENIRIEGNTMQIRFQKPFMPNYPLFLKTKSFPESQIRFDRKSDAYTITAPARYARFLGIETEQEKDFQIEYPNGIFDYQRHIVQTAFERKRYAVYADTGLGKTLMFLTLARNVAKKTGGRVLILSPLQIINQTIEEAKRFWPDFEIEHLKTVESLESFCKATGPGIGITNYEKFVNRKGKKETGYGALELAMKSGATDYDDSDVGKEFAFLNYLAGLIADESSIFKNGGGVIKWNIVKAAAGVEYRFSFTATPAPNDVFEYSSQLSFLFRDKMNMLSKFWSFFRKDKAGNWYVKDHAREAMYAYMTEWSVYMRNPKRYGFKDNDTDAIPAPEIIEYPIEMTDEQAQWQASINAADGNGLFNKAKIGVVTRSKFSQLAKGFIYTDEGTVAVDSLKPTKVVKLAMDEVNSGRKVLIWTVFDEESTILDDILHRLKYPPFNKSVSALTGKTPEDERQRIIDDFRHGKLDILISKAQLLGYGMNFQACKAMIFSGWNDSYEQFYQAVRRAVRYGQTDSVRVHIPYIPQLEGMIYDNVLRKKANFHRDAEEMEKQYIKIMENTR